MAGAYAEAWGRNVGSDTSVWELACALLVSVVVLSLEVHLLKYLYAACAKFPHASIRWGVTSVILLLFSIFQVLCWSGLYLYGSFPNVGSLASLMYTEVHVLSMHMTAGEYGQLARVGVVSVAMMAALWMLLRHPPGCIRYPRCYH